MEFELIIKKLDNRLSKKEEEIFNQWFNESTTHKAYFLNVQKNYQKKTTKINIEKGWPVLQTKISRKKNYFKYTAAAIIILLISLPLYYYNNTHVQIQQQHLPIIVKQEIEIGRDKAILTLEDGSTVSLEKDKGYKDENRSSNGEKLIYSAKNAANKNSTANIVYNYLSIPRGGEFFLKLADGTEVWLNSETKLKYPTTFIEGQTRSVELIYGEAYFNVSHSTNHNGGNFEVKTQTQLVEVLGTEFNIKAYKGENVIATTLVKGKVSIENKQQKKKLSPNEQSVFNISNNELNISTVDVYNEVSWRKGFFSFKDKSLKEITKVLERWYSIDIVFENKTIEKIKFNGVLRKKQDIENILSIINNTTNIAYEIKEKTVILK